MLAFRFSLLPSFLLLLLVSGCAVSPASKPSFPLENPTGQRALKTIPIRITSDISDQWQIKSADPALAKIAAATLNQHLLAKGFSQREQLTSAVASSLTKAGYQVVSANSNKATKAFVVLSLSGHSVGFSQRHSKLPLRPSYTLIAELNDGLTGQALGREQVSYNATELEANSNTIRITPNPARFYSDAADLTRNADEAIGDMNAVIQRVAAQLTRSFSDPDLAPAAELPAAALNHQRPAWGTCHGHLSPVAALELTTSHKVTLKPKHCLRLSGNQPTSYQLLRLPKFDERLKLTIETQLQNNSSDSPLRLPAVAINILSAEMKPLLRFSHSAFAQRGTSGQIKQLVLRQHRGNPTDAPRYLLIQNDPTMTGRAEALIQSTAADKEQLRQLLYAVDGMVRVSWSRLEH